MHANPTRRPALTTAAALATLTLLLGALLGFASLTPANDASPLSVDEIVHRMVAMNAERTTDLQAFTSIRDYHLEYDGLGHDVADMQVQVVYQDPGPKKFTLLSESGSGMLRHHVLEPLLRTEEQEAWIDQQEGPAIAPKYYSFQLVDFPRPGAQASYVLAVTPLRHAKRFLFEGKIWVNPVDFGLERAEGKSVRAPSWWVPSVTFQYRSQKVGDFWLPATNNCISHIRLFGHATLTITYRNFQLTSVLPVNPLAGAGAIPATLSGARP